MSLGEIDRAAIQATIREFDAQGRTNFLERYGYGKATTYLLRSNGKFYDPKAVVGVAHSHTANGVALKHNEFDATEAIARLGKLGFEVLPFNGLWWVNQGDSYGIERDGGFVWAPQQTKAGHPVAHHTNVSSLRVGQRIVHYATNFIRAVGTVAEAPSAGPQPQALRRDTWINDGFLCPVDYRELAEPIPRQELPTQEFAGSGPFARNGNVNQGYMYRVPDEHLFTLLEFLDARVPDLFGHTVTHEHYAGEESDMVMGPEPANPIIDALLSFKNVVLEGVPGTGKTFAVEKVAAEWEQQTGRGLLRFNGIPFQAIVLHPSSSYEDFVEGLRPGSETVAGGQPYFDEKPSSTGAFEIRDGFFVSACIAATKSPDKDIIVLLDELNRCNVPSVFGDLLLSLEKSRRAKYRPQQSEPGVTPSASDWVSATPVDLPYSGRRFFVPDNIYVIATMNTTDRSVAPLDAALRRRFAFYRLEPLVPEGGTLTTKVPLVVSELFARSSQVLQDLNGHCLRPCLGPDAMLGHSYLYAIAANLGTIGDSARGAEEIRNQWRYSILPQLVDSVRALGAEDLLTPETRELWLDRHADLAQVADTARTSLEQLDDFLQGSLDLRIVVEGAGLSRGARIERHSAETSTTNGAEAGADIDPDEEAGL